MALFKVSEVAKKADMSVKDTLEKLQTVGVNVKSGDDPVREEDVSAAGLDSKHSQLDRRQEMLKKALERHKRGIKIKEVHVGKGQITTTESTTSRKLSKEDLMRKRSELDKRLQKVDEDREIMRERAEAETLVAATKPSVQEQTKPVEVVKTPEVKQPTTIQEPQAPKPVGNQEPEPIQPKPRPVSDERPQGQSEKPAYSDRNATSGESRSQQGEYRDNRDSRDGNSRPPYQPRQDNQGNRVTSGSGFQRAPQSGENRPPRTGEANRQYGQQRPYGDRNQSSRPPYRQDDRPQGDRPQGDRPQGDRPYTPRPQGDRPYTPRPQGDRPYTPRPQGDRPYTPRPQGDRPYTPRPQGDRPYTPRPQGDRPYTPRPQGDRPYTPRPQGDRPYSPRPQGDRPYSPRPQGDRPGGGSRYPGGPKSSTDRDSGLSLTQEEERKRIVKKKEDDVAKEKEAKKPKAKKDGKKLKSWTKTITEGIDELNIEKEVEAPFVISPNIDISDLADVDPDRKPKTSNNYRGKFERKVRRRPDSRGMVQKAFVRPETVEIGERVVISDFGSLIGIKAAELIKKLFAMGTMATVNQSIDAETAQLIGIDYGVEVVIKTVTEEDLLPSFEDLPADLTKRPPIVTVMGHVDHGKTSLLDAIRSTSVVSGEAGGITQHIGAYEVDSASGKIIFLDTPGHEAFTTLRARGALLTDIVILVVAADDGVKPQTKEAIDHAKAAGVRIVVAINKIDKDGANPDRVRQQLAEYGIIPEDWGGEYQFQEISAKKRIGMDDLLERVLLEAEVLDLKGNPNRDAEGIVIESRLDKQKGPVATVLVKNGTLKKGDCFISGSQSGKVRAMFNFKGSPIKEAGVSIPAEVMGFSEVPEAGEKFIVTDEKIIKQVAELRLNAAREKQRAEKGKQLSLADIFSQIKDGQLKELNIVLKADAQGSAEALISSLLKLSNQEVKVNIIHDGIGAITESDVSLANASKAIIIGFNVRPDNNARQVAEKEGVSIELYSIIYKAIDDVKLALEGLLSPEMKENVLGRVEIRQVFSVPKIGKIAGCFVLEGKVVRNSHVRLIRNSIVIFDGKISSLKRFTDDTKEVAAGYECGLSIDKYQDIKENDVLEVYEVVEEKRTLEDVAKAEREKTEKAEKAEKAEKEKQ